jgi:elongation factor P
MLRRRRIGVDVALDTSQFRNGFKIELDGEPYSIVYFQHVKPGKGGAFVRTKVKNLKTGRVLDRRFRSGEKVEEADVEDRKMQFLYRDGEQFVFMDSQNYEQTPFTAEQVGEARLFLRENLDVDVLFWRGSPINVELPAFIEAVVAECEPGLKGDTASNVTKPATLETGAVVQVPLFIKEGERIRVDTRSGEYVERVN